MSENPYKAPRLESEVMADLVFDRVCITSDAHLASFCKIHQTMTWMERFLGSYQLPPGFPRVSSKPWFSRLNAPLIFWAHGRVSLTAGVATYESTPFKLAGVVIRNLRDNFSFRVNSNLIQAIEPYVFQSPINRFSDVMFIRLSMKQPISGESDLLLTMAAVGLTGRKMRKKNEELLKALLLVK